MSVLGTLSALALILPNFTTSTPGPLYSSSQLAFVGLISLVLYCIFVFVQTVRHRDYFLPSDVAGEPSQHEQQALSHAAPPSNPVAWSAAALLMVCLVAVVGLAGSYFFVVFIQHVTPGAFVAGMTLLTVEPGVVALTQRGAEPTPRKLKAMQAR